MASGELYISIFTDYIMLEMFKKRGKNRELVRKHYEELSLPLVKLTKVDLIGFEKNIASFIAKSNIKKGKVRVSVFGDRKVVRYEEVDLGTSKLREMKNLLPFEIDALGDEIKGFKYRHEFVGSVAKLHMMKEEIVTNLSLLVLPKYWELEYLIPGYVSHLGIVTGNGILLDVNKEKYGLYAYVNGILKSFELNNTFLDYDPSRPENPDIEYLISSIDNDVSNYLKGYRLLNPDVTGTENVIVLRNGNTEGNFGEMESDLINYMEHTDSEGAFAVDRSVSKGRFEVSSVVIGLCNLDKSLNKFDFSPEKLGLAYKNLLVSSVSFSLVLLIGLPVTSYWVDNQLSNRYEEVSGYNQTLVTYEGNVKDLNSQIKGLDKTIDDYNAYVGSLERLSNVDRNFISGVLGYLPDNTPSSIYVESLSLTKGTKNLVVKGVSNNYKDIGAFAIQLEQFGTVRINDIENNELLNMDGYPFELELKSK